MYLKTNKKKLFAYSMFNINSQDLVTAVAKEDGTRTASPDGVILWYPHHMQATTITASRMPPFLSRLHTYKLPGLDSLRPHLPRLIVPEIF